MEGLAQLVSESMARHGVDCSLDYRRLHWSRWFPCLGTADLNLVPSLSGILAIAEEVIAPGETTVAGGKRMLAVLKVTASDDLAIAVTRLLAPPSLNQYGVTSDKIFVRYTVVQDRAQRRAAENVFQRWLATSSEAVSGLMAESSNSKMMNDPGTVVVLPARASETASESSAATEAAFDRPATVHPPAPLPSGF
jgi:hypothetical protein